MIVANCLIPPYPAEVESHSNPQSAAKGPVTRLALLPARRESARQKNALRSGRILTLRWRFTVSRKKRSTDRERADIAGGIADKPYGGEMIGVLGLCHGAPAGAGKMGTAIISLE